MEKSLLLLRPALIAREKVNHMRATTTENSAKLAEKNARKRNWRKSGKSNSLQSLRSEDRKRSPSPPALWVRVQETLYFGLKYTKYGARADIYTPVPEYPGKKPLG